MLQLTGQAHIDWDSPAVARFPGARRLVSIVVEEVTQLPSAVPLRWDTHADSVRALRLVQKVRESDDVVSFVFEARDGGPLPDFEAGQHLPLELGVAGRDHPVERTYSLSGAPGEGRYRISVKRVPRGIASQVLHDAVRPGAILDARRPTGDFVLGDRGGPVVLVSAGIGITPMISMLHSLAAESGNRPVWFVHGARDGAHHPFADEVRTLAERRKNIELHIVYSRPRPEDRAGIDYDSEGRVDGALLAHRVTDPTAHYFLCGPTGFMADVQGALEHQGVSPAQIHTESFGPR